MLDRALTAHNGRELHADEERHLRVYREYAARCRSSADLILIGHVHRPVDEPETETSPRLIVLGGWQHRASYLRVDGSGAQFRIEDDGRKGSSPPLHAERLTPSVRGPGS
jgi:UDP-2,3-diacylglucosamine hydrolase